MMFGSAESEQTQAN